MKKNPTSTKDKIVENVKKDRDAAHTAYETINSITVEMPASKERAQMHQAAAKFLEAAQRSNEQLLKVYNVESKSPAKEEIEFDEEFLDDNVFTLKQGE